MAALYSTIHTKDAARENSVVVLDLGGINSQRLD